LAWQCGYPHPRHLFDAYDISDEEAADIVAYGSRYPLNVRRVEIAAAKLAYVYARSQGAEAGIAAYLDWFDLEAAHEAAEEADREQTADDMEAAFRGLEISTQGGTNG
jgi:hypothetical protein